MDQQTNPAAQDADNADLSEQELDQVAGGQQQPLPPVPGGKATDPGGTPYGGLQPWPPTPSPEDPPVYPVPHPGPTDT